MNPDRIVPQEPDAERALLGAAMLGKEAFEVVATEIESSAFYVPTHSLIHSGLVRMYRSGFGTGDMLVLWDEIQAMGSNLDNVGGPVYLNELQAATPSYTNFRMYLSLIIEAATMRDVIRVGGEITELGYNGHDAAAAVALSKTMLGNLDLPIGGSQPSPDIKTFLNTEVEFDWMVPGLIERQDRLILTGPEGGGKSTWLRQIGMCLAAGIHPFRFHPIEPSKVLLVDIENTMPQIQRKYRPYYDMVEDRLDPANLRIEVQTGGIDLTARHDHRWLIDLVATNRPDLLIIGPAYKLHAGDPNDETPARAVIAALDSIRSRFGCALFIEAHSPHGGGGAHGGRPIGASIWKRWPEFGYGLWPPPGDDTGEVVFLPWRGSRDARDWPTRLVRGAPGQWPWVDPDYSAPDERF